MEKKMEITIMGWEGYIWRVMSGCCHMQGLGLTWILGGFSDGTLEYSVP